MVCFSFHPPGDGSPDPAAAGWVREPPYQSPTRQQTQDRRTPITPASASDSPQGWHALASRRTDVQIGGRVSGSGRDRVSVGVRDRVRGAIVTDPITDPDPDTATVPGTVTESHKGEEASLIGWPQVVAGRTGLASGGYGLRKRRTSG